MYFTETQYICFACIKVLIPLFVLSVTCNLLSVCRFAVNFCCGGDDDCDIAFHFNPRLAEKCSIRNSFVGGDWQAEERDQPCFPFEKKETFEIAINIKADRFIVSDCMNSFD